MHACWLHQAHYRDWGYGLAPGRRPGATVPQQGASPPPGSVWGRGLSAMYHVVAALKALFRTSPACVHPFKTLACPGHCFLISVCFPPGILQSHRLRPLCSGKWDISCFGAGDEAFEYDQVPCAVHCTCSSDTLDPHKLFTKYKRSHRWLF